jgi:hypothetical protein
MQLQVVDHQKCLCNVFVGLLCSMNDYNFFVIVYRLLECNTLWTVLLYKWIQDDIWLSTSIV